jgi:hypothetical protein
MGPVASPNYSSGENSPPQSEKTNENKVNNNADGENSPPIDQRTERLIKQAREAADGFWQEISTRIGAIMRGRELGQLYRLSVVSAQSMCPTSPVRPRPPPDRP